MPCTSFAEFRNWVKEIKDRKKAKKDEIEKWKAERKAEAKQKREEKQKAAEARKMKKTTKKIRVSNRRKKNVQESSKRLKMSQSMMMNHQGWMKMKKMHCCIDVPNAVKDSMELLVKMR